MFIVCNMVNYWVCHIYGIFYQFIEFLDKFENYGKKWFNDWIF